MRRGFLLGAVIVAVVVAVASVIWLAFGRGERTVPSDPTRISATRGERGREAVPARAPTGRRGTPPDSVPPVSAPDVPTGEQHPEPDDDAIATAWSGVDLEEVRKAMPENLYWKLSRPTKDPQVLEERDAERARWNVEYGKILSGTATDEEIRAFYDHRARLSGDYIEFATYLLDHYGSTLPERDVGLLKLALRLHRARIEEIPRKIEQAFERKRAQDEARAAWLADQATFGPGEPDSAAGADAEPE